jgi:hypothetical protein
MAVDPLPWESPPLVNTPTAFPWATPASKACPAHPATVFSMTLSLRDIRRSKLLLSRCRNSTVEPSCSWGASTYTSLVLSIFGNLTPTGAYFHSVAAAEEMTLHYYVLESARVLHASRATEIAERQIVKLRDKSRKLPNRADINRFTYNNVFIHNYLTKSIYIIEEKYPHSL